MKKNIILFSPIQYLLVIFTASTGFMPKNNLSISIHDKNTNGMTHEKFETIIKRVFAAYSPNANTGKTLQ
jgi:hypothetical protein